jgi:hypothetical protein
MEWQIEYIEKEGIVSANISGPTTMEEHRKFTAEMILCARHHNTHKIFVDATKMVPDLSVLEIDEMPNLFKEAGLTPADKMAVLFDFSSPMKKNFAFFGNVTSLRSFKVQPFADKDEAIAWLKSDHPDKSKK